MKELNYFNDKRTCELAELKDVKTIADAVHVRIKWALCNKNDLANPDMRARLVACKVNKTAKQKMHSGHRLHQMKVKLI